MPIEAMNGFLASDRLSKPFSSSDFGFSLYVTIRPCASHFKMPSPVAKRRSVGCTASVMSASVSI